MPIIVRFNGKDLPAEMATLSPGEYLVESSSDAPPLTAEEEEGIQAALDSLEAGKVVDAAEVRRRVAALLR